MTYFGKIWGTSATVNKIMKLWELNGKGQLVLDREGRGLIVPAMSPVATHTQQNCSSAVGGPSRVRPRPFTADKVLSDEDVESAIAVLKHSADEDNIREKMKATFIYRQSMVNNEKRAGDVFSVFPRFLDTPGLIEQDFRLLFGEATANKFLEKWATNLKTKVIKESHGLVPVCYLAAPPSPTTICIEKEEAGEGVGMSGCETPNQIHKSWNQCTAAPG
ncbi:uncharacterized protein LOC133958990 [Platichthys flesus]|uniref:uncharacterized protein LOC133958990 n=1 Tax=Platichthys flesus TaxID=8260 RepID=UPI002DBB3339|nr:uncharacterized protein LOC133958990 [Platichthys flesus]